MKENDTEMTAFEKWLEDTQDPRDYPDGFNPDLYDLQETTTVKTHGDDTDKFQRP
ncbi:hypothetical protein [Flagellimonas abyssi]|uniref:YozE SAM-like domain-containing protein n=1 Tax=Flagellimonas abyssi TaxID=2864871 RepID=A0ABS7EWN2_9FLAO|nr:hypothetical protein [Allomuricauda abyssi]MBW8201941.1 hypothetical protein [Allomuricauda abyssi]